MVLERLQQRMRELKIKLGGKIRQLEVELKKSEAGKVLLREKLELEIKTTRLELGKGSKKKKNNYGKFHIGSRPPPPLPPLLWKIFFYFFF